MRLDSLRRRLFRLTISQIHPIAKTDKINHQASPTKSITVSPEAEEVTLTSALCDPIQLPLNRYRNSVFYSASQLWEHDGTRLKNDRS